MSSGWRRLLKPQWLALVTLLSGFALGAAVAEIRFSVAAGMVEPRDIVTMVASTGTTLQLCWQKQPVCPEGSECIEPYNLQWRWYRTEDGTSVMGPFLHVSEWKPSGTPDEWCLPMTVPAPGHWVYEARFCGPPAAGSTEPRCDIRSSVGTSGEGFVDGLGSKPWWIYSYAPRPGVPSMWPVKTVKVSPLN